MSAIDTISHLKVAEVIGLPLYHTLEVHDMTDILDVDEVELSDGETASDMIVANILYLGGGSGEHAALPLSIKQTINYALYIMFDKYRNPDIETQDYKLTPQEEEFIQLWNDKFSNIDKMEPPIDLSWWTPNQITEVYKYSIHNEIGYISIIGSQGALEVIRLNLIDRILLSTFYAIIHEMPTAYLLRHNIIDVPTLKMINQFKKGLYIIQWHFYTWCSIGVSQDLYGLQAGQLRVNGEYEKFTISDLRNRYQDLDDVGSQSLIGDFKVE